MARPRHLVVLLAGWGAITWFAFSVLGGARANPATPEEPESSISDHAGQTRQETAVVEEGAGDDRVTPSAGPLFDELTNRISFQALLTDDQGNALPGPTVDLSFMIYTALLNPIEGPILLDDVPIENGVVAVMVPVSPSSFDGTLRKLGVSVNGRVELSPLIEFGSVPYAFRVDRVENEELTDDVELGDPSTSGSLTVYSGGLDVVTMTMDGPTGELGVFSPAGQGRILLKGQSQQMMIFGDDGIEHAALWGFDFGQFLLSDADGDTTAGLRAATIEGSGANLFLGDEKGAFRLFALASTTGGELQIYDDSSPTLSLRGENGVLDVRNGTGTTTIELNGSAHRLSTYGSDGLEQIRLWGASFGEILLHDNSVSNDRTVQLSATSNSGGEVRVFRNDGAVSGALLSGGSNSGGTGFFFNASGAPTIELDGDDGDGGAVLLMRDASGTATIDLDANGGGGGAGVNLRNSAGAITVVLDADDADDGALLLLRDASGTATIDLDANGAGGGAGVVLRNSNGISTLVLDADDSNHAEIRLSDNAGITTIEMVAREGSTGGQIEISKADGTPTITLDAEFGAGGDARLSVDGKVLCEEVEVQLSEDWPDFVFEDDYPLMSLVELDRHIAENKHLPGIATAAEVKSAGINLGRMDAKLLEKIEELTLYVIGLNRKLNAVEQERDRLEQRLARLEADRNQAVAIQRKEN